jgi:hypothetical protein
MKFLLLVFSLTAGSPEIDVAELPMPDQGDCHRIAADISSAALSAAETGLVPTLIGASCVPNPDGYPPSIVSVSSEGARQ